VSRYNNSILRQCTKQSISRFSAASQSPVVPLPPRLPPSSNIPTTKNSHANFPSFLVAADSLRRLGFHLRPAPSAEQSRRPHCETQSSPHAMHLPKSPTLQSPASDKSISQRLIVKTHIPAGIGVPSAVHASPIPSIAREIATSLPASPDCQNSGNSSPQSDALRSSQRSAPTPPRVHRSHFRIQLAPPAISIRRKC